MADKKSFDEYLIKFYINRRFLRRETKRVLVKKIKLNKKLRDSDKIKINPEIESIERKIQDEINRAIERATDDLEFEVTVEEPQIIDNKEEQEREIRIRYATEERLEVDYSEIFSYLDTRPNLVKYEYEFMEKKEAEDSELTPQKIAKINQIKRFEKVLYQRDLKHENPEGVDPALYEKFRLYSMTLEGFVMNMFYYENAFAAPM